jgi:nucleotide-binding universal stress UspA family protein
MNIVVAIDLSAASDRVIAAARRAAELTGARVTVLHVAEPEPDFVGYEAGPDAVRKQLAEEYRREHRAVQGYAEQLREAGVDAQALLLQGPVAKTTVTEAERLGAELIITGSHGHGAVYDVLVGSYSAALLRRSPVPVLVVPTRD